MQKRKQYTEQERGRWLAHFKQSGKSAAAFCREHRISYQALLNWRKADRKKADTGYGEVKFVEVGLVAGDAESSPRARAANHPIAELELPGSILLRIFAPRDDSGS